MKKSALLLVVLGAFASLSLSAIAGDSSSYGASNVNSQASSGGGGVIQGAAGRLAAYAGKTCSSPKSPSPLGTNLDGYIDSSGNFIFRSCNSGNSCSQ